MALPEKKKLALHARGENALSSAWYMAHRTAGLCCSDGATIREKSILCESEVRAASKDKAVEEDGKRT